MPFSESFLSKVLCSQVDQSASAHRIEKFGKVHLFLEHGGKVQPWGLGRGSYCWHYQGWGQSAQASHRLTGCMALDCRELMQWTSLWFTLFRFLTALNQSLISKLRPAWNSIVPPKGSPAWSLSGVGQRKQCRHVQHMNRLTWMKEVCLCHWKPFQPRHTQRRRYLPSLARWSMWNIHCEISGSSIETTFYARSYPVATIRPGRWCLLRCKLTVIWPTELMQACWTALALFPLQEKATH